MPADQETETDKAVIYCRVSSSKQTHRGDGLNSQETRCREYARYKGYEVVGTFADDMSGSLGLKCPECGHDAKFERDLCRPRRAWILAGVGLLLLLIGAYFPIAATAHSQYLLEMAPRRVLVWVWRIFPSAQVGGLLYRDLEANTLSSGTQQALAGACAAQLSKSTRSGWGYSPSDDAVHMLGMLGPNSSPAWPFIRRELVSNPATVIQRFHACILQMVQRDTGFCDELESTISQVVPDTPVFESTSKFHEVITNPKAASASRDGRASTSRAATGLGTTATSGPSPRRRNASATSSPIRTRPSPSCWRSRRSWKRRSKSRRPSLSLPRI